MTKIVELIFTDNLRRGKGVKDDPVRRIEQYFEKNGDLIFEKDCFPNFSKCAKKLIDLNNEGDNWNTEKIMKLLMEYFDNI